MDLFDISGRRAIVTGAGQGMGNAIARAYAECGANVALLDMRADIEEIAAAMAKEFNVQVVGVKADLSVSDNRKAAFNQAVEALGGLDILVNCAGITHTAPSVDFPMDAWDKVLSINLDAVFELSQLAGRVMIPQKSGKIINFASMLSYIGGMQVPAYAASKGAVMQITKSLTNEWAQHGIQVNAIAPGYIDTALSAGMIHHNPERSSFILSRIPAKRWGQAEDMLGVAIMLAAPASDYISGAIIAVDGGFIGS